MIKWCSFWSGAHAGVVLAGEAVRDCVTEGAGDGGDEQQEQRSARPREETRVSAYTKATARVNSCVFIQLKYLYVNGLEHTVRQTL